MNALETCKWLSREAAIVASNFDQEAAVAVCRCLTDGLVAGRIELRPVVSNNGLNFSGKLLHARFESTCAVCGTRIALNAPIIYNIERKRAAHEKCGRVAT